MTWAKLDDGLLTHPKAMAAGIEGRALYIAAILYSARELTDGVVSFGALAALAGLAGVRNAKKTADLLVTVGLFNSHPDGYIVHDYLDYNPSRADVLDKRQLAKENGSRGGRARANRMASGLLSDEASDPLSDPLSDWPSKSASEIVAPIPDPLSPVPDPDSRLPEARSPEAGAALNNTPVGLVFKAAESLLGREPGRTEYELLSEKCAETNPEWILQAITVARENQASSLRYAFKVLAGWGTEGPPKPHMPGRSENGSKSTSGGIGGAPLEDRKRRYGGVT